LTHSDHRHIITRQASPHHITSRHVLQVLSMTPLKLHCTTVTPKDQIWWRHCAFWCCPNEIRGTESKCKMKFKQDAQLSQRDRAAGCVIVFAKSRTLELGANDLRTL